MLCNLCEYFRGNEECCHPMGRRVSLHAMWIFMHGGTTGECICCVPLTEDRKVVANEILRRVLLDPEKYGMDPAPQSVKPPIMFQTGFLRRSMRRVSRAFDTLLDSLDDRPLIGLPILFMFFAMVFIPASIVLIGLSKQLLFLILSLRGH